MIKKIYKTSDFINANRLDVIAKYLYVKSYAENDNLEYATGLYKNTVLVTTKGAVIEPGSFEKKHNMSGYIREFNSLIDSISRNGFDSSKDMGSCGAHRAACLLYFGQEEFEGNEKVFESYADCDELKFDAAFFQNNLFKKEYLISIIIRYILLFPGEVYLQKENGCLFITADNQNIITADINAKTEALLMEMFPELAEGNPYRLKTDCNDADKVERLLNAADIIRNKNRLLLRIKYMTRRIAILVIHYMGAIKPLRRLYPSFKYYS